MIKRTRYLQAITKLLLTPSSGFPAIVTRFYLQTLPKFRTCTLIRIHLREEKDYRKAFQWILDVRPFPFARHYHNYC